MYKFNNYYSYRYGWFTTSLISVSKDPRLRFSKKQSDFVTNELVRRKLQKGLLEKKFAGLPFRT